jgi:hypothetical protein
MRLTPTPLTAALAGIFSALAWPWLWARFVGAGSTGTMEAVIITLLVIALPAHAFVVGMANRQPTADRSLDTALLKRIGAWMAAAAVTVLLVALLKG